MLVLVTKYILIIFFYVGFSQYSNANDIRNLAMEETKSMNILHEKPYFVLDVDLSGSKYYVTVNGVPVVQDSAGNKITAEFPLNHLMRSGKNTIAIEISPKEGDIELLSDAHYQLALKVSNYATDPNEFFEIEQSSLYAQIIKNELLEVGTVRKLNSQQNFIESDNGDVLIKPLTATAKPEYGPDTYLIEQEINIPSNLPLWGFFQGDKLPEYDDMPDELYYQNIDNMILGYDKILKAIQSGNIAAVIPYFNERSTEIDKAFYQPAGTTAKKLQKALEEAASESDSYFLPLSNDTLLINYYDNMKHVRLMREDGSAALVQNFKGVGSQEFDIVFRLEKGKWVISR